MAYELKIGNNISTTDPTNWRKCTPAKIKAWWEAVKQNVPNYDNYNWHLVGGMANGSQSSKDADVVITPLSGEVYDEGWQRIYEHGDQVYTQVVLFDET